MGRGSKGGADGYGSGWNLKISPALSLCLAGTIHRQFPYEPDAVEDARSVQSVDDAGDAQASGGASGSTSTWHGRADAREPLQGRCEQGEVLAAPWDERAAACAIETGTAAAMTRQDYRNAAAVRMAPLWLVGSKDHTLPTIRPPLPSDHARYHATLRKPRPSAAAAKRTLLSFGEILSVRVERRLEAAPAGRAGEADGARLRHPALEESPDTVHQCE